MSAGKSVKNPDYRIQAETIKRGYLVLYLIVF